MTRYVYTRHKEYTRKKPKNRLKTLVSVTAGAYAELQRRKQAKKEDQEKARQEDEARHERMIQFNAKLKAIEIEHQVKKEKEAAKRPQSGSEYSI